jgi:hypothetical protein
MIAVASVTLAIMVEQKNGFSERFVPRDYKQFDLLDSAVCKKTAILNDVERFSLESIILRKQQLCGS